MRWDNIDPRSLPVQLILSFVALVLLTAATIGLPVAWLLQRQLEGQAWTQVEQGQKAALALYAAGQNDLIHLATLTAQRPTLARLLAQGGLAELPAYLATLQRGAGLDLILVCDANQDPIVQTNRAAPGSFCDPTPPAGFRVIEALGQVQIWQIAAQPLGRTNPGQAGQVVVGVILDDRFARQMQAQTGLPHSLLVKGRPVATSLSPSAARQAAQFIPLAETGRGTFSLNGEPYYAASIPLAEPDLAAEVVLPITDIAAARQSLAWTLAAGLVVVAAVGSGLGILLARQISQPLAHLTEAATTLSQGHLDSSLATEARVREISLVARALEKARLDLLATLTRLQHEKAWTDHLLEAIVEGIVTLNEQGQITFFSPAAERIMGRNRAEVLQRHCDEIFHPVESDKPFSHFIPPPGRRHKITVETANQRQATLDITGAQLAPPGTGDDGQVALVFRDVSEEEIVHRLMGHFLANVAHEFRTPLTALAASVELLLDQAPNLSRAELQELLTSLHLGILGLQTLVDNLLESASIEAGRFRVNTRPANLGKIVAEVIRIMQPLLARHNQRLTLDLPAELPPVRADARRTTQVLVNLLSNASKYGPDDAEIALTAVVTGAWVRLSVADRGPGVLPQYRKELFRRFAYPGSGGDKSQYGAGLGLSVVKAVIEAQGGRVGVEDRPGGGLAFWFTLPVELEV